MSEKLIRPGVELTGSILRDAIGGARPNIRGSGAVVASSSANRTMLHVHGIPDRGVPFIWTGEVVGATLDGVAGDNRWTYDVREIRKTEIGYGQSNWSAVSEATGGLRVDPVYNMFEDRNSSTGTQGNGVVVEDLLGSYAVQPIPNGTIVAVIRIPCDTEELNGNEVISAEHWIVGAPNGVTGTCPPEPPQALQSGEISNTSLPDGTWTTLEWTNEKFSDPGFSIQPDGAVIIGGSLNGARVQTTYSLTNIEASKNNSSVSVRMQYSLDLVDWTDIGAETINMPALNDTKSMQVQSVSDVAQNSAIRVQLNPDIGAGGSLSGGNQLIISEMR